MTYGLGMLYCCGPHCLFYSLSPTFCPFLETFWVGVFSLCIPQMVCNKTIRGSVVFQNDMPCLPSKMTKPVGDGAEKHKPTRTWSKTGRLARAAAHCVIIQIVICNGLTPELRRFLFSAGLQRVKHRAEMRALEMRKEWGNTVRLKRGNFSIKRL